MSARNRKGFTLIELLIVVVIIGILASIAIPKFAATKDKAKLASVKTDIRNIITGQEAYFADYNTYTNTLPNTIFFDPAVSTMYSMSPFTCGDRLGTLGIRLPPGICEKSSAWTTLVRSRYTLGRSQAIPTERSHSP